MTTQQMTASLRGALESQYHAALAMLRESSERCPEDLWLDGGPKNAFWQIAYHAGSRSSSISS